jgi:hypothetical protein
MIYEGDCGAIGGMKIDRGNRSIGENLPQRHFVHHKSHMTRPVLEPGPPQWEAKPFFIFLFPATDLIQNTQNCNEI